jgi:HAE1 family hydrophobic/amphiphilic exporter-1
MFSRFFIEHPIFANVIAVITMIVGGVALYVLPVEQYPAITPPTVQVSTIYPGASARVVSDTVASPIEQEVNGVENMLYMSSTCASDGSYRLTVTFEVGTDLDTAQVLVQNRVSSVLPKLPEEVQRQGVLTKKQSTSILLVVNLFSPKDTHDSLFLSNYATLRVRDVLSRIYGVGDVRVSGAGDYGMRIWLDPEKLKARRLTTQDVLASIREQNVQVAAGQVGQPPAPSDQPFQYTVTTLGRLSDPEQFENIIIKAVAADGAGARAASTAGAAAGTQPEVGSARLTRLKDVARVELGSQTYDQYSLLKGRPSAGVIVFLLPGANALDVARQIRAAMDELKPSFPPDLDYAIPFNTTTFIEESVSEVYHTLFEAAGLVIIVILLFLQDWRAVLIPATTVPVTIVGAFAAMYGLGYSVNMLTLFGLVLAIGIVVDDAIVIVENAVHHIDADGLDPKRATIKAMDEVLGPIIGITLVLMAVFLPASLLPGITGQLYRQFALTIAATAVISAVNAVTLKPAQSAQWLRHSPERRNWFFRGFNRVYGAFEGLYVRTIRFVTRHLVLVMLFFAMLAGAAGYWFTRVPTGFLPTEDQGYAVIGVQLPDAASQGRTRVVVDRVNDILSKTPGIGHWVTIGGQSLLEQTTASNAATFYIIYEPWDARLERGLDQDAILMSLRRQFAGIQEGAVFTFPPPAIRGLGVAGGFQMQVEDRGGSDLRELQNATEEVIAAGGAQSSLRALKSTFSAEVPQLYADVDRTKVKSLDIPLGDVFGTLQANLGSAYVNDFNKFGRTYQVRVQADQAFRQEAADIRRLEVRNRAGQMVPLGTLVNIQERLGPQIITRYNLYPSAAINGEAAPGFSSGEALTLMEQVARRTLPAGMDFEWTGMSFQERQVGSQAVYVFGMAVLLVYLVLAAQYESWVIPLAVILVVPLALLGTLAALTLRGLPNDTYAQIGIVLIIALASKNAILIVEFARDLRARGMPVREAAVEAARLRFRPILMTSFAFILGVLPLVLAEGAGAASRRSLGTAVFGGMIAGTFLAVFFVPAFYLIFQRFLEWRYGAAAYDPPAPAQGLTTPEPAHPGANPQGTPEADGNGHAAANGDGTPTPRPAAEGELRTPS